MKPAGLDHRNAGRQLVVGLMAMIACMRVSPSRAGTTLYGESGFFWTPRADSAAAGDFIASAGAAYATRGTDAGKVTAPVSLGLGLTDSLELSLSFVDREALAGRGSGFFRSLAARGGLKYAFAEESPEAFRFCANLVVDEMTSRPQVLARVIVGKAWPQGTGSLAAGYRSAEVLPSHTASHGLWVGAGYERPIQGILTGTVDVEGRAYFAGSATARLRVSPGMRLSVGHLLLVSLSPTIEIGGGDPVWGAFAGVSLGMGATGPIDVDGDDLVSPQDRCPREAEDRDGFQDDDGCLDPDNDADRVIDKDDGCPLDPGPADNGGCPIKVQDQFLFPEPHFRLRIPIGPVPAPVAPLVTPAPPVPRRGVEPAKDAAP